MPEHVHCYALLTLPGGATIDSRLDIFRRGVLRSEISSTEVFEMTLSKLEARFCRIAGAAAVAALLAGCGGSGAPASTTPATSTPQTITGIATPSSVAVVTATN